MAYPIKMFSSADVGAAVHNGTPNSTVGVFESCLITGINPVAIASLTWKTGIATATCNSSHGYREGDILKIEGAVTAAFNGEHRVKSVTANSFAYEVAGSSYASPVVGTISARKAPAGWRKPFVGTNVAVFQSADTNSTQSYLRIDDTDPRYARVRGYTSMVDLDNGQGPFPTLSQQVGAGLTWAKSDAANSTPRDWLLIADSSFVWWFPRPWASYGACVYAFGDPATLDGTRPRSAYIKGSAAASPTYPGNYGGLWTNGNEVGGYLSVAHHGVGGAIPCGTYGSAMQQFPGWGDAFPFPNPDGGCLIVSAMLIAEKVTGTAARGYIPGLYQPLHNQPLSNGDPTKLRTVDGSVRQGVMVDYGTNAAADRGRVVIDLDGPWR